MKSRSFKDSFCRESGCLTTKNILTHIMSCDQNEECSYEDCSISKMIMQQWTNSRRQTSEVSLTVKHPMGYTKNIPLFRYRFRSHDWCNRVINYRKWKYRRECWTWMKNIFLSVNGVGVNYVNFYVLVPFLAFAFF